MTHRILQTTLRLGRAPLDALAHRAADSGGKAAVLGAVIVACLLALLPASASGRTVWLCKPGAAVDPCVSGMNATVYSADGGTRVQRARRPARPPIDCFYVYPTVSEQKTINANLHVDPQETAIAHYQAARFSQVCRVWAPMYRQLTLQGIGDRSKITPAAQATAYSSVRSAWRDYLAHHNRGRGVVLLGHSQGTFILRQLIKDAIDRRPAVRRRLVSALLLGGNVTVRKGADVGGDFSHVRACRSPTQLACVVAYSMYNDVPPANSLFGRTANPNQEVLCTNPAALRGGTGTLRSYQYSKPFPGTIGLGIRILEGGPPLTAPTPWVVPPGHYTARCQRAGGASFLRIGERDGAKRLIPSPDPTWGLHLADVNLALGNLVALVGHQARAYGRSS